MIVRVLALLLVLCSLVLGQASIVHNGNNGIIHAGLIAEYRLNETGQQAFNYATSNPAATTNLVGFPEQAYTGFSGGSTTPWAASNSITDNFAVNPIDGQTTAARWVSLGSTAQVVTQHPTLSAAQYTFSLYAKSNTGSTQKIRLAYHNTGGDVFSSDLSVTTSWQQLSFTSTSATTITQVFMPYNDVAQDALDILIYGPKIEAGASATAYVPADGFLQMGNYLAIDSLDPTRSTTTGINNTSGKIAVGTFSTPQVLSGGTIYAVARWSGGVTAQAYYEIVTEHWASQQFVLAGQQNNNPTTFNFGGTSVTSQAGMQNDSQWHLITGSYNGTTARLFIDNMEIGSATASGLTQTIRQLVIGATPDELTSWLGDIAYISIYNNGHSDQQRANQWIAIQNLMSHRGITINNPANSRFWIAEGDSITDYTNLGRQSYFFLTTRGTALTVQGRDFALSGSKIIGTVSSLTTRAASVDAQYDPNRKANILSVMIGANDLDGIITPATYVSRLETYCAARRAVGWTVVVSTISPQKNPGSANPNFIADRNAANALILAEPGFTNGTYANAIADVASDATVGCDTCGNNATYYPDGLHPSAAATVLFAPYFIAAIQSVY